MAQIDFQPEADAVDFQPERPAGRFDTPLSSAEEQKFQQWKQQYAPRDSGMDYDLRGAFKAGLTPAANGHWPDTFKKPNHPTFSDQSIYASQAPDKAGSWNGDTYFPPGQPAIDFQPESPRFQFGPTDIYNPPGPTREDLLRSEQAKLRAEPPAGGLLPSVSGAGRIVASDLMGTATDVASGLRHAAQFTLPPIVSDIYGKATAPVIDYMRQSTENAQPSDRDQATAGGAALKTLTDVGQYVVAPEKALPALIGAKTAGETTDALFKEYKDQGLSDEEAGAKALHRGLASGVAQAALWEFLPPQLKKIGDGLIDKAFNDIGPDAVKNLQLTGGQWFQKWLAGKVSQAGAGAVMGATTTAAQNLATGQPVLQGVPENTAGMALGFAAFPRDRTAGDLAKAKSDAYYREFAYWHDYYGANPNRQPGPDINPISPQGAAFDTVRGGKTPAAEQTPLERQIGATINEPTATTWTPPPQPQEPNASTIRTNQTVVPAPGQVAPPVEKVGGDDLELPPPGRPEPLEPGAKAPQPAAEVKPFTDRIQAAAQSGQIVPVNGSLWSMASATRPVVFMKVGTGVLPFYRSSRGTGGAKKAGDWQPFFGIGNNAWVIKGTNPQIASSYGSPEIVAAQKWLNQNFNWPQELDADLFYNAHLNPLASSGAPVPFGKASQTLLGDSQFEGVNHDDGSSLAHINGVLSKLGFTPQTHAEAMGKAATVTYADSEEARGHAVPLKSGDEAPVKFVSVQPGATHVGWYEPTRPFVSNGGGVYYPALGGKVKISSSQIASNGFTIPSAELAKFKAAGGTEKAAEPKPVVPETIAPKVEVKPVLDSKGRTPEKQALLDKMAAAVKTATETEGMLPKPKSTLPPNVELNELRIQRDARGKLGTINTARIAELEAMEKGVTGPVEIARVQDEDVADHLVNENVNYRSYEKSGDDYVVYSEQAGKEKSPAVTQPADVTLSAGNVNTTADVAAAQKAKPLGTGSTFNAKVAKEQKKFLLDAVDQAIAEAPKVTGEITDPVLKADLAIAKAGQEDGKPKAWEHSSVKGEYERLRNEWATQKMVEFQDLFEKYKVPTESAASLPYKDIAGGMHQDRLAEVHSYEGRMHLLIAEIERLHRESLPKVTIEVPGDGTFEIINSKKALADFKERAARFPTTAPRQAKASTPRINPSTPGQVGKLDKATVLKALEPITSDDPERAILRNVWSDGKQTVATNGRMLTRIELGVGGTVKKPEVVTLDGKIVKFEKGDKAYPNWQQVVPPEYKVTIKNLDIERTWMLLRQAMEATSEKSNSVKFWINKDKTIGLTANATEVGSYETNKFNDSKSIFAVSPQYFMAALTAARKIGDTKFDLSWNDELGPIGIRSEHAESVVMPMRLSSIPNSLGEASQPIKSGEAQGVEGIRKLIDESGADAVTIKAANQFLDSELGRMIVESGVTVRLDPDQPHFAGAATVAQNLIELFARVSPDTLAHEGSHIAYEWLPQQYRDAIERARVAALQKHFGGKAPDYLLTGKMTSDQYMAAGLPTSEYHMLNASEFLASFVGSKFKDADWEGVDGKPASWWRQLYDAVKDFFRRLFEAVKLRFGVDPKMDTLVNDFLNGRWKPTKEGIIEFAGRQKERQGSLPLPRSLKEQQQEQAFNYPGTNERVVAGYGDLNAMQRRAADSISATPEALAEVGLTTREIMAGVASSYLQHTLNTVGNYQAMRQRTAGPDTVGIHNAVAVDGLRGLEAERRRWLKTREKLAPIETTVRSEIFQDKLTDLDWRRLKRDSAAETRKTFINQAAQEHGDVLRASQEKGRTEAEIETLKQQLKVLDKITEHTEAISQRVDDIIATVGATEDGAALLAGVMDKTGTEIYRAYLDLKASTASQPEPRKGDILSDYDQQFLSEAEKAKLNRPIEPALTGEQKLFAQLASSVLAANSGLRWELASAEYARNHPEFKAKLTELGERFKKQFEADPNNAVKQMLKMSAGLTKKEITAEAAYLRLHRKLIPVLHEFQTLKQADTINRMVENSPEFKALVNQINADVGGLPVPTNELTRIKDGTIWNEGNGRQALTGPGGGVYEIDLGHSKSDSAAAHATMRAFLQDVEAWQNDATNANSPDQAYWSMRHDLVSAILDTDTNLNPPVVEPLGLKSPFTIAEFFFKSASIPQAKLTYAMLNNASRAWNMADQWFARRHDEIIRAVRLGMESHNPKRTFTQKYVTLTGKVYDPMFDLHIYQDDILSPLASEYLSGRVMKAGDRLYNGIAITQADLDAMFTQGRAIAERHQERNNLGREKMMPDHLILDEWDDELAVIRKPQELAAKAGATLPRKFSQFGRDLALRMADIPASNVDRVIALLSEPVYFDRFVKNFIGDRKADYSRISPFEDLYKQLAGEFKQGTFDGEKSIAGLVEWLSANTGPEWEPEAIQKQVVGEMEALVRNYYKNFVEKDPTGATSIAMRSEKDSSFTSGHGRDVGPSSFYDYGVVTAPEIRKLAIDSVNYHMVRFAKSLDSLVDAYDRAIATMEQGSRAKNLAFKKAGMLRYHGGQDFANWQQLSKERSRAYYFKSNVAVVFSSMRAPEIALWGGVRRLAGDVVKGVLSGLGTLMNVTVGSPMKMALVMRAMRVSGWAVYPEAFLQSAISLMRYGKAAAVKTVPQVAAAGIRGVRRAGTVGVKVASRDAFIESLNAVTRDFYAESEFYRNQSEYGMGFHVNVGARIANILTMPNSHGQGYKVDLSDWGPVAWGQKRAFQLLVGVEAPLELINAVLPQWGYVVSYDATAHVAGRTIDKLGMHARRRFEFLERTGGLDRYQLDDPGANVLIYAEDVLPNSFFGLVRKGQTDLNLARNWFSRAIDVSLNRTVLNYWRALKVTPPERRGEVSWMAADLHGQAPKVIQHMEEARIGALIMVNLKDVHHASPENRPWLLRTNPLIQLQGQLMGWFAHGAVGTPNYFGQAPHDPQFSKQRAALMRLMGLGAFLALAVVAGENEGWIKRFLNRFILHKELPTKPVWEARDTKEAAEIALVDATSMFPILHGWVENALGVGMKGGGGPGSMLVDFVKRHLDYMAGVINTGDLTYHLAGVMKSDLPFSALLINQLESQKGLLAANNLSTIARLYGDPDLVKPFDPGAVVPTPLSPIRSDLANAVFSGDVQGARIAADNYVAKAVEMGRTPEKAQEMLQQALNSFNPYQRGFGEKLTADARTAFLASLPQNEAAKFATAESNWSSAMAAIGTGAATMTKVAQKGAGGAGGAGSVSRAGGGASYRRPALGRLRGASRRSSVSGGLPRGLRASRLRLASSSRRPTSRLRRPTMSRLRRRSVTA